MLLEFVFGKFEGVFNKWEKNHGNDSLLADCSYDLEIDIGGVGSSDFLQFDVVADLLDFASQGGFVFIGFVQDIAEDVGKLLQIVGSDLG